MTAMKAHIYGSHMQVYWLFNWLFIWGNESM